MFEPSIAKRAAGTPGGMATMLIRSECVLQGPRQRAIRPYAAPSIGTRRTVAEHRRGLENEDGMNLDGAHARGGILRRPAGRLGAVLAVQDEVAVEPKRSGVRRSIGDLGSPLVGRDAEGRRRQLARIAVMEDAGRLELFQI